MINYVVRDLDRMIGQLRKNGVKVENYDYRRFAWITNPEGNRIETCQPSGQV